MTTAAQPRTFSVASIIAVISALLCFSSGGGLGAIFASIAIISGLIGVSVAIRPGTRGGITSFFALTAGIIGLVTSVMKGVMWLL